MEGVAGGRAFRANGSRNGSFAAGGAFFSAAGGVLGSDYNHRHHAVIAGAAFTVSWQRFLGTALGGLVGAIMASHFGSHAHAFGACVFILGLLCAVIHLNRSAYRFAGITAAIVLLVPRTGPAWHIAFHRFAEVSVGIGVALIFAGVWPEREDTASGVRANCSRPSAQNAPKPAKPST